MVGVEQWAEVRRLHFVRGLSIRELSRRTGLHRDTIRRALSSEAPPVYRRAAAGSKLDPFKDEVHRLLGEDPKLRGQRIRELIAPLGFDGGKTILDDYLREVRPLFSPPPRIFQRTVYRPGEICQFDLWEPREEIPVGHGQRRRGSASGGCARGFYSRPGPCSCTCCTWSARAWPRGAAERYEENPLLSLAVAATFAVLFVATAFLPRAMRWPLSNRVARGLGDISFGVFLYHLLVLHVVMTAYGLTPPTGQAELHSRADWALIGELTLIVVPASLAVAWLSTVLVERPLRARFRSYAWRFEAPRTHRAPVLHPAPPRRLTPPPPRATQPRWRRPSIASPSDSASSSPSRPFAPAQRVVGKCATSSSMNTRTLAERLRWLR